MADDETNDTRVVGDTLSGESLTAATDAGNPVDYSDEAILRRIFARYYNHIEDLGIPDDDRRAQLALDLGFLVGFAFRSLEKAAT